MEIITISNKKIVVFGNRSMASMVAHGVMHATDAEVAGFTVHARYIESATHETKPLVAFEELENHFPPATHALLIPVGPANINESRAALCDEAKNRGYDLFTYMHPSVSRFPDTPVGEHCLLFENVVLQSYATVGSNVIIRSGANIGHHNRIADNAFIATGVVTGGNVTIGENAFIGLGAVIRDGVTIAPKTLVGAGAVVLHDTEAGSVYAGNPAKKLNKTSHEATSNG